MAGTSLPSRVSGHSLLPLLSLKDAPQAGPLPDWVLSEYHGCDVNASTYMLRRGQWKYIAYADGSSAPPQLFGKSAGLTVFKAAHYQTPSNGSFCSDSPSPP